VVAVLWPQKRTLTIRSLVTVKGAQGARLMRNMEYLRPAQCKGASAKAHHQVVGHGEWRARRKADLQHGVPAPMHCALLRAGSHMFIITELPVHDFRPPRCGAGAGSNASHGKYAVERLFSLHAL